MSNLPDLRSLNCYDNQLTALDLSQNTKLNIVKVSPQQVTVLAHAFGSRYTVDLKALVGEANFPNVRVTKGALDRQTGIWTIDSLNDQFYLYPTEKFGDIKVLLNLYLLPTTGDSSRPAAWLIAMLTALCGMAVLSRKRKTA